MPPRRGGQPQAGWGYAKEGARSYISKKDKTVNEGLLSAATDAARASISNWTEWNFARTRETFTTDGTDFFTLGAAFAGELGIYQTTGNKNKLIYMIPDEYEQVKLQDSTRQSDLLYYTNYNAKEVYPYPLPASGIGITVAYNLDLMDKDTELPARFFDAQFAWILHHYGAPKPDAKYSWRDVAERDTDKLRIRDRRPSGRRPLIPNLELEEVAAIDEISLQ